MSGDCVLAKCGMLDCGVVKCGLFHTREASFSIKMSPMLIVLESENIFGGLSEVDTCWTIIHIETNKISV